MSDSTGSVKSADFGGKSGRVMYLHDIPVKYDKTGALGTWFVDREGDYHCVFQFGARVYQCVKSKPYRSGDCPQCSFEGTVYKCGGSCFDRTNGGIKV